MSTEPNQVRWRGIRLAAGENYLPISEYKVATGTYNQVTVGTSATEIKAANSDRLFLVIRNHSSTNVFIGLNDSVTTANGVLLGEREVIEIAYYTGAIYGIVASGSATVSYIEC